MNETKKDTEAKTVTMRIDADMLRRIDVLMVRGAGRKSTGVFSMSHLLRKAIDHGLTKMESKYKICGQEK